MSTLQRRSQRRRNLPFPAVNSDANSDPSGDLSMSSTLLRGKFVRMLAVAAFAVHGSGCRSRPGCAGPCAGTGPCCNARARHRACHDQRQTGHRGRPRAGARRSRPAVRAAAGRTAPRRRHVGDHRDQAAGRKGRARKGSTSTPDFQRRIEFLRQRTLHSALVAREVAGKITDDRGSRPLRPGDGEHAAGQRSACASHPREDQGRGGRDHQAARRRRRIRRHRQGEIAGSARPRKAATSAGSARARWCRSSRRQPSRWRSAPTPRSRCRRQFGWHVIKVEDKRAQQPPAFEQVKEQVRSALLRDKYFALVENGP